MVTKSFTLSCSAMYNNVLRLIQARYVYQASTCKIAHQKDHLLNCAPKG